MAGQSPFATMDFSDVQSILMSCPDLAVALHKFEKEKLSRFCDEHDNVDGTSQSTWRLHAALIHLMVWPLVEQFQRACTVAAASLGCHNPETLEMAFQGQARDSFVWLQCLMSEETSWCTVVGCPACSATRVTGSDLTVRAVMTAALLSTSSHAAPGSPDFSPVLPALQTAICNDPFWSPMHYPHLLSRSHQVVLGLRDLNQQCTELHIMMTTPPGSTGSVSSMSSAASISSCGSDESGHSSLFLRRPPATLIPLKPSKLARRQRDMRAKEEEVRRGVLKKWMFLRTGRRTERMVEEIVRPSTALF